MVVNGEMKKINELMRKKREPQGRFLQNMSEDISEEYRRVSYAVMKQIRIVMIREGEYQKISGKTTD